MWNFLKWFFGLFSSYVNSFERRVDKFFSHLKSTDSIATIKGDLLELMQENVAILTVWLEKEFKGYKDLNKSKRRKLYANLEKIVVRFREQYMRDPVDLEKLKNDFEERGLQFSNGDEEKLKYLAEIADFLRPGKYYAYLESSAFFRLLADFDDEKMEGDCNQIVTFYIYLYSLKYPIGDLKIKLLPEHVCLSFREVDLEATSGEFKKYSDVPSTLPVTEIVATNILDLNDLSMDTVSVGEDILLKSAQLAYATSSLREVVTKNLQIAYHNVSIAALNVKNYEKALFYADKMGDREFIHRIEIQQAVEEYNALAKKVAANKTVADARAHKSDYLRMLELSKTLNDANLREQVEKVIRQL